MRKLLTTLVVLLAVVTSVQANDWRAETTTNTAGSAWRKADSSANTSWRASDCKCADCKCENCDGTCCKDTRLIQPENLPASPLYRQPDGSIAGGTETADDDSIEFISHKHRTRTKYSEKSSCTNGTCASGACANGTCPAPANANPATTPAPAKPAPMPAPAPKPAATAQPMTWPQGSMMAGQPVLGNYDYSESGRSGRHGFRVSRRSSGACADGSCSGGR